MQIYKTELISRIKRTPSIESFRFLPETKVSFIPGQFLQVLFDPGNPGNKELNKYLSFCCSPTKDYIEVTKRLSDSQFSQRLKDLKIGAEVSLKAPMGACVFKEEYQKIGFLIGGIGITPVISIIEYIAERKLNTSVSLLYSNRSVEEIAFTQVLDSWRASNKNIRVTYLVSEGECKDKNCILGRIDKDLIKIHMPDAQERMLFIFGPPKMVEAMQALALEIGCRRDNIKIENFIGY